VDGQATLPSPTVVVDNAIPPAKPLLSEFSPQFGRVVASFFPPSVQICQVRVKQARLACPTLSLWKRTGSQPALAGAGTETYPLGNILYCDPLPPKQTYLVVLLKSRLPVRLTLLFKPRTTWRTERQRIVLCLLIICLYLLLGRNDSGQLLRILSQDLLNGLDEIVNQVPPVSYLDSFRSSRRGPQSVTPRAVPTDDLNSRMLFQPIGQCFCFSIRKEVYYLAKLQVTDGRAVVMSFAKSPVIDSDHPKARGRDQPMAADKP